MTRKCKKCQVPLEGFGFIWIASKIFGVRAAPGQADVCSKCAGSASAILIDTRRCIGCGACIRVCRPRVLYIHPDTKRCRVIDQAKCDRNGLCVKACKSGAITVTP